MQTKIQQKMWLRRRLFWLHPCELLQHKLLCMKQLNFSRAPLFTNNHAILTIYIILKVKIAFTLNDNDNYYKSLAIIHVGFSKEHVQHIQHDYIHGGASFVNWKIFKLLDRRRRRSRPYSSQKNNYRSQATTQQQFFIVLILK